MAEESAPVDGKSNVVHKHTYCNRPWNTEKERETPGKGEAAAIFLPLGPGAFWENLTGIAAIAALAGDMGRGCPTKSTISSPSIYSIGPYPFTLLVSVCVCVSMCLYVNPPESLVWGHLDQLLLQG